MALLNNNINSRTGVTIGNRSDFCYLCATEIEAQNEAQYQKKFNELKGSLEGKPVMKIFRSGTETCICLEHIHKIAKENPLPKEK